MNDPEDKLENDSEAELAGAPEDELESDTYDEARAYQLAKIAATLMSHRILESDSVLSKENLSSSSWDEEFDGALKRADILLRKAQDRNVIVCAYQVFREGELLSADKIASRFTDIKWPGFKRNVTVTGHMNSFCTAMTLFIEGADEYRERDFEGQSQAAHQILAKALGNIGNLSEITEEFPEYSDEVEQFLKRLSRRPDVKEFPLSLSRKFIEWCFVDESQGKIDVRRYRPHEIFRFLEAFTALPEAPKISLSQLAPSFFPFPEQETWPVSFRIFDEKEKKRQWQNSSKNPFRELQDEADS